MTSRLVEVTEREESPSARVLDMMKNQFKEEMYIPDETEIFLGSEASANPRGLLGRR